MRFAVLEPAKGARVVTQEGLALLEAQGRVQVVTLEAESRAEGIARFGELVRTCDAVVISPWFIPPTTRETWSQAAGLKVLAGTFDNRFAGWMDFAELDRRGVVVIDTSRSMTPSVAEFALAMTLNLIRNIPAAIEIVRRGEWKRESWANPEFVFGDLTGRNVGLAGLGSINRRYAELLEPFKCTVRGYDPFVGREVFARYGVLPARSLVELASSSEILVIGIPPTPATLGIINAAVIDALPKGALLVLVTRMAVVEQEALWRRVRAGELMAAVDVFAPEPPPADAFFRKHPCVLPTPHIAGDATYCHRRCFTDACRDVITVLNGGEPRFRATAWDDDCYQGRLTTPVAD